LKTAKMWAIGGLLVATLGLLTLFDAALARADSAVDAQDAAALSVSLTTFATGLNEPVGLVVTGAISDTRLFVLERRGVIRIVTQNGSVLATPYLSMTTKVTGSQTLFPEVGLLGLAFDPDYASNGKFYVYYTDTNGDIQISRFSVSGDPNVANPAETQLLKIPHPTNRNHNGGQLAFGPDGYLYLGTGDGGSGGDPPNNAQNLNSRLGKILRLNVTGVPTYTVPATNPFTQTVGAKPEIWARGLRNPWRFSFDRSTHELYIGDVGQDEWEEIDRQPASSHGGENYGWRCYEGAHVFNLSGGCPGPFVLPVAEYSHTAGDQAVTGGYVYRGSAYPALRGYYLYADYVSGRFWAMQTTTCEVTPLGHLAGNPTSFGQDAAGELYVADQNGTIYRVVGPAPSPLQTPIWLPLLFSVGTAT